MLNNNLRPGADRLLLSRDGENTLTLFRVSESLSNPESVFRVLPDTDPAVLAALVYAYGDEVCGEMSWWNDYVCMSGPDHTDEHYATNAYGDVLRWPINHTAPSGR